MGWELNLSKRISNRLNFKNKITIIKSFLIILNLKSALKPGFLKDKTMDGKYMHSCITNDKFFWKLKLLGKVILEIASTEQTN